MAMNEERYRQGKSERKKIVKEVLLLRISLKSGRKKGVRKWRENYKEKILQYDKQ